MICGPVGGACLLLRMEKYLDTAKSIHFTDMRTAGQSRKRVESEHMFIDLTLPLNRLNNSSAMPSNPSVPAY